MRLLPTTLVLAGILLATPLSASADGRMCMVVPEMTLLDGRASFFESPASLRTAVGAADEEPAGRQGIMWCQSADDPRCTPVHPDSGGTPEIGDSPLRSAAPSHHDVADPSADEAGFLDVQARPCTGVRLRVERPPRM